MLGRFDLAGMQALHLPGGATGLRGPLNADAYDCQTMTLHIPYA